MFVPTMNSSRMRPAELLSEVILRTPSTPSLLLLPSTISRSTSCGLAPGQRVSTVIVGVSTSGVSCIGIAVSDTNPNSAISSTPTAILTGLWTKASISCIVSPNGSIQSHDSPPSPPRTASISEMA